MVNQGWKSRFQNSYPKKKKKIPTQLMNSLGTIEFTTTKISVAENSSIRKAVLSLLLSALGIGIGAMSCK